MSRRDPQAPTVLVVSHEASRTGAPRVAVELLGALRAAGHRTVVAHRWGGPLEAELNAAADHHVDEPLRSVRVGLRRWPRTKGLADRLERTSAQRLIRQVEPDLVWCNTLVTWRYAVVAASLEIPVVLYGHEQSEWTAGLPSSFGRHSETRASDRANITLVGCSQSAGRVLADAAERAGDTIDLLHSPVDVDDLLRRAGTSRALDQPTVVGCGSADERKGFDVFVEAAARAEPRGIDATWRWIGRAPEDVRRLPSNVQLVGEIDDPAPEIAASTVFVCPSRADSFPLVVLEAMALARPVVASRIPGIEEQLGDTGLLVEPGDAPALLAGVEHLLVDSDQRESLGARAQSRCRDLWDVSIFRKRVKVIAEAARVAP